MAEFNAPTVNTVQHAGEYGNAAVAIFNHIYAGEAAGSLVKFGKLSGAITITRVTLKHADLGGAQTYDLGYRYLNTDDGTSDPDGFVDGTDTGTAGATVTAVGPWVIADGDGIEIVGTNIGDAATGRVDVIVEYVYRGQK